MNNDLFTDGTILVLGATGAGKSFFCNKLKANCTEEGHTLRSMTTKCQVIEIILDDDGKRSVAVVDTPGFDDTTRPEGEVLSEITEFLAAQHALGIPLRGVLFLHKITENKMTGSSLRYLKLLESLVGQDAWENVILVTTMWNKLRDEHQDEAIRREQELLDDFWAPMVRRGSYVAQFGDNPDTAMALISQLAGKETVVLKVQREMAERDPDVAHTAVGISLIEQLEKDRLAYAIRLAKIEDDLEVAIETANKDQTKRLHKDKAEVEAMLSRIEKSIVKMQVRPGSKMTARIKEIMAGPVPARAVGVLAAALNISLFVVRMVTG